MTKAEALALLNTKLGLLQKVGSSASLALDLVGRVIDLVQSDDLALTEAQRNAITAKITTAINRVKQDATQL